MTMMGFMLAQPPSFGGHLCTFITPIWLIASFLTGDKLVHLDSVQNNQKSTKNYRPT